MQVNIFKNRISNLDQQRIHQGVAFEWPEEEVIYADIEYPTEVIPTGLPIVAYFLTLSEKEKPEEAILKVIEEDFSLRQGFELQSYIGILIDNSSGSNEYHAFRKKEDLITPCQVSLLESEQESVQLPIIGANNKIWTNKKILIVGCGSFGSALAIELCKAGVNNFILIDKERIKGNELHRSVGSLADIGRQKTNVLREVLLQKNRHAKVQVLNFDITENSLESACKNADLIIGLTNQRSNFFVINQYAREQGKPVIFAKANNLASFGYIFRSDPSSQNAPCYNCMGSGQFSFRGDGMYFERTGPVVATTTAIQDGPEETLNMDLLPYVYMLSRVCLEFLSEGRLAALPKVGAEESALLLYPTGFYPDGQDPIVNRYHQDYKKLHWYPVTVNRDLSCSVCSTRP